MQPYQNVQGTSAVEEYEIDPEDGSLWVRLKPTKKHPAGRLYHFTAETCGGETLESMIELAVTGIGLATYLARNKPDYESRT